MKVHRFWTLAVVAALVGTAACGRANSPVGTGGVTLKTSPIKAKATASPTKSPTPTPSPTAKSSGTGPAESGTSG